MNTISEIITRKQNGQNCSVAEEAMVKKMVTDHIKKRITLDMDTINKIRSFFVKQWSEAYQEINAAISYHAKPSMNHNVGDWVLIKEWGIVEQIKVKHKFGYEMERLSSAIYRGLLYDHQLEKAEEPTVEKKRMVSECHYAPFTFDGESGWEVCNYCGKKCEVTIIDNDPLKFPPYLEEVKRFKRQMKSS